MLTAIHLQEKSRYYSSNKEPYVLQSYAGSSNFIKKRAKICENNLQYAGYEYALWCEAGGKMPASVIVRV